MPMQLQTRPYHNPDDYLRMHDLLIAGTASGVRGSYMHPGALDWALHYPPDEQENRHNILLWEGQTSAGMVCLVAWSLYSRHEHTVDLFIHPTLYGGPHHAAIVAEYVTWAVARAQAAGLQQIRPFWLLDYDVETLRLLEQHGYVHQEGLPPPLFARTLDNLPSPPLPEGFVLQHVDSLAAGEQRARVTHSAFRPDADWDACWVEYTQFMRSAVYAGTRDLLVRAPDGRGAAACTIWYDPINAEGLFEPVATHPDFQGRGLGKAVMAEGLRRMQAAGMRRAILGCDPNNAPARALYTSLGFSAACYFVLCGKDL